MLRVEIGQNAEVFWEVPDFRRRQRDSVSSRNFHLVAVDAVRCNADRITDAKYRTCNGREMTLSLEPRETSRKR